MNQAPATNTFDSASAFKPESSDWAVTASDLSRTVHLGDHALQILEGVSFQISRGESVAIVGASGSGKSTLLGLLAGLDRPTRGEVQLAGQSLSKLDEDGLAALRAAQVGFVFQAFQLLTGMTALENVMLPLELLGDRDAEAKAREWLQRVGLGERLDHSPRQLSGGEQQRVAIARAFVTRPAVLFADEPTGNLDTATGERILDLLLTLHQRAATTIVMVTHSREVAARADRILVLDGGHIQEAR